MTQLQEVVVSKSIGPPAQLLASAIALRGGGRRGARPCAARRAPATWHCYESEWRIFTAWCESVGLVALPAEAMTVAMILGMQANAGKRPRRCRDGSRLFA